MSVLLLPPIFQFFDDNGDPLANGFVYTYAAGTTTPLATYTSSSGLIAAPNPIQLNAAGRPTSGSGAIWGQGAYKFIVRDANGVQVGQTLDNVISFNSLADAATAYAETFSGNGVQTVFTTSQDLGTDSKALLVSTASGLQQIALNGDFATDTIWNKGAGWTIAAGVATAAGAISTAISQVPTISLVAGQAYAVTYTITVSAGTLTPSLGAQAGVARSASGTYREIIIAAATTPIAFTGAGFTGTLDNVSVTVATSQPMTLLPANAYTISGTTLTFASAPALGVNNIDVRSPSLLVGAAASSAALAQLYAANALTSSTTAATAATSAQDWATKTTGQVAATDYSSKAYAIGGTGVTGAIGASKEWAISATSPDGGSNQSAKTWAQTASAVTIPAGSISNAKLATMADQTFKGNVSGSTASPSDLTAAQMQTALGITAAPSAATQAQQEAASSTTTYVSPGRQQFHPSASKAWVICDSAGNINASYNVASITDGGVGLLTVTFSVAFSSANYVGVATVGGGSTVTRVVMNNSISAGSYNASCVDNAGTLADPAGTGKWHLIFFGDQ